MLVCREIVNDTRRIQVGEEQLETAKITHVNIVTRQRMR